MSDEKCAAGPWEEGAPDRAGRYLVEYEHHNQRRVFVGDYDFYGTSGWQWSSLPPGAEVLRYARIRSEHVRYPDGD